MQLNAITRKSALMAMLLLVVILVATVVRARLVPFDVELAESEYHDGLFATIIATLLFLFGGFMLGKIFLRSGLSKNYCALPMPIYGILTCGLLVTPNLLTAAAISLAISIAIFLLLRSLHCAGEKDSVFFAALLLGTTAIVYPPNLLLAVIIPLAVVILALSMRQAILMIIGYLLPLLASSYILWYRGDSIFAFGENLLMATITPRMGVSEQLPYLAIIMGVVVIAIMLWGLFYSLIRPNKMFMLTRVRRSLHLFVWLFVVAVVALFLPGSSIVSLSILAIPTTILLSISLNLLPNNQSTIAYWLLLLLTATHLFIA